jgi:hypothetical protein
MTACWPARAVAAGIAGALLLASGESGPASTRGQRETATETYFAMRRQAEEKVRAQDWAAASRFWERATELNPHLGESWAQLAYAYYQAKEYQKAIRAYELGMNLGAGFPATSAFNISRGYAMLGDRERAFAWLDRALAMGFRDLWRMRVDVDLDSLRSDLRFKRLAATEDVSRLTRDEGWRYDLAFFARELFRLHHAPFRLHSREEFESEIRRLHDAIPQLNDPQIEVRLMKLARMAGDGHTIITPNYLQRAFRRALPIQMYLFNEGLFITGAAKEQAALVGAQVLQIGGRSVEELLRVLDPLISRDNEMRVRLIAPELLRQPQILYGLGLLPSPKRAPVTLRDASGTAREVGLEVDAGEPDQDWVTAHASAALPEPLYLKSRHLNYWFEYLPTPAAVYFQFNAVRHDPQNQFDQFCARLFKFIAEKRVEKLIIDLRWNGGGNNPLNQSLLHGLIRSEKINQRGRLFVIIGRNTFGAAICAAAQIERQTPAIFVGEPTGSSPNFIGEKLPFALPWSRITASVSDLYWQNSTPADRRPWIAPEILAPPTFAAFRDNRDPALEAILALPPSP